MTTTAVKFKLYLNAPQEAELEEYFYEYSKAVNFAAKKIYNLRKPFKFAGKRDTGNKKWIYDNKICAWCKQNKEIYYFNLENGDGICKKCYDDKLSDNALRKRFVPLKNITRRKRIEPRINIHNASTKISNTHMHYAVEEAAEILDALKAQVRQRQNRYRKDISRLKLFEEIKNDETKRYEVPLYQGQRVKRFIHISQIGLLENNMIKGYTLRKVDERIRVLNRNLERLRNSIRATSLLHFKGNRVRLTNASVKFNPNNNKVCFTLIKQKEYNFSGIGNENIDYSVKNEHGRKFFNEKLNAIVNAKPRYCYLIRKNIELEETPKYEYYLQYTIQKVTKQKSVYDGIIGIDRGINKIGVLVFLRKGETRASFVKFFDGKQIKQMKIKQRKQKYYLIGVHNKKQKLRKLRPINLSINAILHTTSKDIVSIAEKKNAAIALEKLEKPQKGRLRQYKKERYTLSLFTFKTLSQMIKYKAESYGIKVIEVPPEYTSQQCSKCKSMNTQRPYNGVSSLFKCNNCGITLNADYNAAVNIATKGLNSL